MATIIPALTQLRINLPEIMLPPVPRVLLHAAAINPLLINPLIIKALGALDGLSRQMVAAAKTFEAFDKKLAEYRPQAHILGQLGWTLPMLMPAHAIPDILEGLESDSNYDDAFEHMYAGHDHREFKALLKDLLGNANLAAWRDLLSDCGELFLDGHHRVILPALLTVFEGAFATSTNSMLRRTDVKGLSAAKRKAAVTGIDILVWASLEGFVASLFQDHRFSESPPKKANRHWISHGRSACDWTRADALRLFQAIHTVSYA